MDNEQLIGRHLVEASKSITDALVHLRAADELTKVVDYVIRDAIDDMEIIRHSLSGEVGRLIAKGARQ